MSVGLFYVLLGIGIFLIIVGLILEILGFIQRPVVEGISPVSGPSFPQLLMEWLRKLFKKLGQKNLPTWEFLFTWGTLLLVLGVAFLVASVIPGVVEALAGSGAGSGGSSPSPTPSP